MLSLRPPLSLTSAPSGNLKQLPAARSTLAGDTVNVDFCQRNAAFRLRAVAKDVEESEMAKAVTEPAKASMRKDDETLFNKVADALSFAQVRSEADADLLWEARETTAKGERMTLEQYGALRRKIGGTAQDFFKEYIDVDGEYTDEGWVDKTCWICKKDTSEEPRTVDVRGRYAHVNCSEERSKSGNFFTKLFSS